MGTGGAQGGAARVDRPRRLLSTANGDAAVSEAPLSALGRGIVGGSVASAVVLVAMVGLFRALAGAVEIAPQQVTRGFLRRVGAERRVSPHFETLAATIGPVAYGAACGALFAGLARRSRWSSVPFAQAFATAVYALSYLGWIPLLGLMAPAWRLPVAVNVAIALSHLVYGTVLGFFHRRRGRAENRGGGLSPTPDEP
jgi:hypothetical protein